MPLSFYFHFLRILHWKCFENWPDSTSWHNGRNLTPEGVNNESSKRERKHFLCVEDNQFSKIWNADQKLYKAVLRIRFILIWIRIRILGSVSWNNGSGSCSKSDLKSGKYQLLFYFFSIKKYISPKYDMIFVIYRVNIYVSKHKFNSFEKNKLFPERYKIVNWVCWERWIYSVKGATAHTPRRHYIWGQGQLDSHPCINPTWPTIPRGKLHGNVVSTSTPQWY